MKKESAFKFVLRPAGITGVDAALRCADNLG